jgi:hypothetical protein
MKQEIAKTFYDKEIHLMNKSVEKDAEGGVKTKGYTVADVFKGNVNFSNCEKIQEEYGLDYKINITITTDCKDVKKDDILAYNKVLYEVKGIYINDSHVLIVGANWQK